MFDAINKFSYCLRLLLINGAILCLLIPHLMMLPHTFEHCDERMLLVSTNKHFTSKFCCTILLTHDATATPTVRRIHTTAAAPRVRPIETSSATSPPARHIDPIVAIEKSEQCMHLKKIFIQVLRCTC